MHKKETKMAYYLFFFRRLGVEEPRPSENHFRQKQVYLYRGTRHGADLRLQ